MFKARPSQPAAKNKVTQYCLDCGCTDIEGKCEKCINGKGQHRFMSTEGRGSITSSRKYNKKGTGI